MRYKWEKLFSPGVLSRGLAYYENGFVGELIWDEEGDDYLSAEVYGTEIYEVEIGFSNGRVDYTFCSCPYAEENEFCKHMAAVLYAWEDTKSENKTKTSRRPSSECTIEEAVMALSEDKMRELLLEFAKKDKDLYDRILPSAPSPITKKEWMKNAKEIRRRYCHNGYLNYYHVYDYFTEFAEMLKESVESLITRDCLPAAFECAKEIYGMALDVDFDDGEGGVGMLYEAFYTGCQTILQGAELPLRETMHHWFLQMCGGTISVDNEMVLQDFLLEEFRDEAFLHTHLALFDRALNESLHFGVNEVQWLIDGRIEQMRRLGATEEEVSDFLQQYRNLPSVRRMELRYCIERGEKQHAITLLLESMELDRNDSWLMKSHYESLIPLLREENRTEEYRRVLSEYVFTYRQQTLDYVEELKTVTPTEAWQALVPSLLSVDTLSHLRHALMAREGYYRELLNELLTEPMLLGLQQYEDVLKPHFPVEIRDVFFAYVRVRMAHASMRSEYETISRRLRKLCSYPDGEQMARALVEEWRSTYRRRTAMLDELKKAGF